MPGRRLWVVDCTVDLAASDVAVVMVVFPVHVGGEKLADRGTGAGNASAMAALRSCCGDLARSLCVVRGTGCGRMVFPGESFALRRQRRRRLRVP